MRIIVLMALATWLAACGVDGEPVQPTAQAKVSITPNGVAMGTRLGITL